MDQHTALNNVNDLTLLTKLIEDLKNDKVNLSGHLNPTFLDGLDEYLSDLIEADADSTLGEELGIDDPLNVAILQLGSILADYRDSINMQNPTWNGGYFAGIPNVKTGNTYLQDTARTTYAGIPIASQGGGDLGSVIDQLFSGFNFPLLEMAFGMQDGNFRYYSDNYTANARLFRIGSVLGFDKTVVPNTCMGIFGLYPMEASWHVEGSWVKGPVPSGLRGTENAGQGNPDKINPLLLNGDFNIIITPYFIQHPAPLAFRIFTSFGMEFGTYAPAHNDYPHVPALVTPNKGFTTGFGPQIGLGFAFTKGPLVMYSHNTFAHGSVYCGPDEIHPDYKYNNLRFEAGIRYGEVLNIRYTRGSASWHPNQQRRAGYNQFTIGLVIPGI
jgi:hypothetical protein